MTEHIWHLQVSGRDSVCLDLALLTTYHPLKVHLQMVELHDLRGLSSLWFYDSFTASNPNESQPMPKRGNS